MAMTAKHVWSVDTFGAGENGQDQNGDTYEEYKKAVSRFKNTTAVKGRSEDMCHNFDDMKFDFIFIDADHQTKSVVTDIKSWWNKLKMDGIMAFHDCNWPTVVAALEKFKFKFYKGADTILYTYKKSLHLNYKE